MEIAIAVERAIGTGDTIVTVDAVGDGSERGLDACHGGRLGVFRGERTARDQKRMKRLRSVSGPARDDVQSHRRYIRAEEGP